MYNIHNMIYIKTKRTLLKFSLICSKLFDCICNLVVLLKQIYNTSVGIYQIYNSKPTIQCR